MRAVLTAAALSVALLGAPAAGQLLPYRGTFFFTVEEREQAPSLYFDIQRTKVLTVREILLDRQKQQIHIRYGWKVVK